MRILVIITNGLKREGIATSQLEYFRLMDKRDMRIDIASVREYQEDVVEEFESYGCHVIPFPNRQKDMLRYIKKLRSVLKANHYDIVHVHGSSCLMAIDLAVAKMAGVRVRIAHSRNTTCDHKMSDRLLRPLFNRSYNVAFACGEDAGRWLFKDRPFTVIHNGKDLEKFSFSAQKREEVRAKLCLSDSLAVGFVGNLKEQKNPKFLLDIFKSIYEKEPTSRFFLMGDGNLRQPLEKKASEEGLQEAVAFMGRISYVNDMLQAMDVMLLPSKWEGLPNVVLEWQACGLPCIVSDRVTRECAVTDLVHFKSIDDPPEEWAELALSLKKEDRGEAAAGGRKALADSGFDLRENVGELRKNYFELVAAHGQPKMPRKT